MEFEIIKDELGIKEDDIPSEAKKEVEGKFEAHPEKPPVNPTTEDAGDTDSDNEGKPLEPGDKFYGTINTSIKNMQTGKSMREKLTSLWTVLTKKNKTLEVADPAGRTYKTNEETIIQGNLKEVVEKQRQEAENRKLQFKFETLQPDQKLTQTIKADINNIWMVGPAGCGKSTMARNVSLELDIPYLCISCGIGTSATEFIGYKYPNRESTKFAEFYAKPSIILIDEITALDPSVAQVLNAALANNEIETTTGLVHRHPGCIIIATSNTFGTGASRQYVANNQLDASTIDRFVGGIIEVDYSAEYESQFDKEVVEYVNQLRNIIKVNELRRIASTRMIITGAKLKAIHMKDWKEALIVNWTKAEKELIKQFLNSKDISNINFSVN